LFLPFSFIFKETKKAIRGSVMGQNLKNLLVAHGEVGALRINFQNLKIFLPTQKSLKISRLFDFFEICFPLFENFGGELTHSALYMYTRSVLGCTV
jgi:hypothetical protein